MEQVQDRSRSPAQRPETLISRVLSIEHPQKDVLLEVAITAVRELGPGVAMNEIAKRARVGKPTLYRAFGSKNGLYAAIAQWFIDLIYKDVVEAVKANPRGDGIIRQAIDAALQRIRTDRNIYDFLMRRARMELSSAQQTEEFLKEFGETIARVFDLQMRSMGYDPAPAPVWAHAIVGMTISVADWWFEHPEVERDWIVDQLMQIIWHGMKGYMVPFDDSAERG
jgi:AcrR family transcriptional regulator